jgi:outer membrane protein, heavy metal efflux system
MNWIRACLLGALVMLGGCQSAAPTRRDSHTLPLGRDLVQTTRPASAGSGKAAPIRAGRVVTLEDALLLALRHNPGLVSASLELEAADARVRQVGLFPNPEFEVEMEEIGGGRERAGFGGSETTVVIAQAFPLGGRLGDSRRSEALARVVAGWDREAMRLEVYATTMRAFTAVLAARKRLSLGEQTATLAESVLDSVTRQVEAGKVAPIEASKARVELALLRLRRDRLARGLDSRRRELAATWGSPDPAFTTVEGDLDRLRTVPGEERLMSLMENSPALARQAVEVERHEVGVELARAEAIPDLVLSAGYARMETEEPAFIIGMSIDLPLFDRNQGGIAEARAELRKARVERGATAVAVRMELADARRDLVLATGQALALRDEVIPTARAAFDGTREGFTQGKNGLLDVLDAQRTLVEAEEELVDALEEHHAAAAEVERLVGRSLDRIVEDVPAARKEPEDAR